MTRVHAVFLFAVTFVSSAAAAGLEPGDHQFSVTHQLLRRSYLVHVPPHAAAGKSLPVVVNFHGGGGHASAQKHYSRMDQAAAREGFIAVYPNGTGGTGKWLLTWNAGLCCGSAAASRVDDVGFVLALLDDLARRTPVDPSRVYATGNSNGAMMAYRVAAEASHRIAAVAGVAGAMTLQGFAPELPMPLMHIHSVDDQRALYDGGLGPAFPFTNTRVLHQPVDAMLRLWLAHNQCPAPPQVTGPITGRADAPDASHTATRYTYGPCRGGTEVVLWKLTGAGHVWPGGVQDFLPLLLGKGTTVIDANSEMWGFFSRFRRQQQ
ncbi:MAG: extracellular catalytic domain type 1 short-chain-length polyhydroxyalkanoate depolymerase [Burkholderiales bacterium]